MKRPQDQEKWNVATHASGALLAAIGSCWLVSQMSGKVTVAVFVAVVIYLASLLSMYVMSALSHAFTDENRLKRFRALDQGCIFLLIVGTYTPISVYHWNTFPANTLLGLMWAIAIVGFISKVLVRHKVDRVSVWIYVALGWMPAVGLLLHEHWPHQCAMWIFVGGLIYSAGVGLLLNDHKASWAHPAWHLMVMLASSVHFAAITRYVVWSM